MTAPPIAARLTVAKGGPRLSVEVRGFLGSRLFVRASREPLPTQPTNQFQMDGASGPRGLAIASSQSGGTVEPSLVHLTDEKRPLPDFFDRSHCIAAL